jgi:diguanylate cyclase (GGDEF)-like protein
MTAPEPGIATLQRRLAREKAARIEAENIAERTTRDLYDTVQELTRSSRLAEMLGDIAVRANTASSIEEALQAALDAVCEFTGWSIGHALVRTDEEDGSLVSLGVWRLPEGEPFTAFRDATKSQVFGPGLGLPGRVLVEGEPSWIVDLSEDPNFPRATAALACGLRSAFALPLLIRTETAGVLEFFATMEQPPDATVLRVSSFVGAQLGRVLERQQSEDRLTHLALYDGLTGLPNRLLLMDRLRSTLNRARRTGAQVDVLYLDIDDFKTINDSRGHTAGDKVLAALAARLQDAVRGNDTVGLVAPFTVARLGGDEFAIVLDDCPDPEIVARRIESLLQEPLQLDDDEVFLSVSVGTALAEAEDTVTAGEDLIARANVAMHEAKRTGKGRIQAFEPRLQDHARRRHVLGEQLHRAVAAREFTLAYQPVIDLADDRVVGAEALIRWQHPTLGTVRPDEFISRAEETGLIVPIGRDVLEEACRQGARWREVFGSDFTMAVNISGRQLREQDFCEMVYQALAQAGLPSEALCLEMTESMLMERDASGIAMLASLRDGGVHLAIDDFGTGYSSLGALRRLPANLLKIDRSFVSSLPEDGDAGTIAWAIVRLGHTLGMPVLAEGVETLAQRDVLREFGCDQAQGYLFSKPVPAQEFEQLAAVRA